MLQDIAIPEDSDIADAGVTPVCLASSGLVDARRSLKLQGFGGGFLETPTPQDPMPWQYG